MNKDLIHAILSYFIAPGFLTTSIIALYKIATTKVSTADHATLGISDTAATARLPVQDATRSTAEEDGNVITPLMSEPAPSMTLVRQKMSPIHTRLITKDSEPLDKDIQFISGESEMPLSVYESPLMNAFRAFAQMKEKNYSSSSDGYYVVHRRKIVPKRSVLSSDTAEQEQGIDNNNNNNNIEYSRSHLDKSIDALLKNETEEDLYGSQEDSEIMLLYGRGPVFDMNSDYNTGDRFEGFED
jgi:hypothetical protein